MVHIIVFGGFPKHARKQIERDEPDKASNANICWPRVGDFGQGEGEVVPTNLPSIGSVPTAPTQDNVSNTHTHTHTHAQTQPRLPRRGRLGDTSRWQGTTGIRHCVRGIPRLSSQQSGCCQLHGSVSPCEPQLARPPTHPPSHKHTSKQARYPTNNNQSNKQQPIQQTEQAKQAHKPANK